MPKHYPGATHVIITKAHSPHPTRNKVVRRSLLILLISISSVTFAQQPAPDCQCRAPGGLMKDLGTVACFNIVGNNRMVRCEMSTNTPYWKELEGVAGCPDA